MERRIGCGFDAHRFTDGRKLILGGVEINHARGLGGHSDADVLSHAVMDALLGSLAWGDIGEHYPPDDPRWKDADSIGLLKEIAGKVGAWGWSIGNIDTTVIAEEPRMAPYRERMRSNIAQACAISPEMVSVKATTTEGMGFSGRAEGIAAQAMVMVWRHAKVKI